MPQAISIIAKFAFQYLGTSLATSYAIATTLTYAATTFAINKAAAALSPKPKDGSSGAGLEVSSIDSASNGRIIYGRVRAGGIHVIPASTSGANGEILHMVLAFAVHEVDSYESTFLDTDEITNGEITAITASANDGKVTGSSKYKDNAWLRRYAGTTSQNVDFILNAAFPVSIPATSRGRGIPYIAASLNWGKGDTYTGGIPNLSQIIKGKKCYDPRLDSSPGNDPTNVAYIAWTSNPALCWADYKMSQTYGQKVPSADIDWTCVVNAANDCDVLVAIPGAATQKRYTFNGLLFTDGDITDNEKRFIDAMVGKYANTDGKHRIFAGQWRAPVYEIDKEDWTKLNSVQTTGPRGTDRFNGVVTYHVDPERNWQRVEAFRRYNDTYKSADGGERVWIEQEQPDCVDKYEAQRKGEFLLRQSRNGQKLSGVLPPRFMKLRTWDNVTLYFDELGWSGKTFTVAACSINAEGSVNVTLVEEQDVDWTDLVAGDYNTPSTITPPTQNPTTPGDPTSFAITTLLGQLRFDLGAPLIRPKDMRYQVLRSPGTLAVAGSYSVLWEGDVTQVLLPADVRTLYYYHGRTVTNSYFSGLNPSTFGIGTAPFIAPESVPGNRAYPDGELFFAASSYWTWVDSATAGGGVPSSRAFFTGSGFTPQRGYVRLYTSSHNNGVQAFIAPSRFDINSRSPINAVPMLPGQRGIAYLSVRGTGSSSMVAGFAVMGARASSPGMILNSIVTLVSQTADERAVSSGTWTTYTGTFQMTNSFYDSAALAILLPVAYGGPTNFLDIGAAQISIF